MSNTSPESAWRTADLGLGGNVGDPARQMAEALAAIDARPDCRLVAVSRLYCTPPWGKTDQAWFFNACARVATTLSPEALLDLCQSLEKAMHRVRVERWGPRTLDIDILTYQGVEQSDDERLLLPHPRIIERAFVLMPLNDYAPETRFAGRTASEWLASVDVSGIEAMSMDGEWWRNRVEASQS